jgi:hypothetical protein
MPPDGKTIFHFKHRIIDLLAGSLCAMIVIGSLVAYIFDWAGTRSQNIDILVITLLFFILLSWIYFHSALGTCLLVASDGLTIKGPFLRIYCLWGDIDDIGEIDIPKSIYTEPGIIFKKPSYQIDSPFLPRLIDGKALPLTFLLSDKDIKKFELLVKPLLHHPAATKKPLPTSTPPLPPSPFQGEGQG